MALKEKPEDKPQKPRKRLLGTRQHRDVHASLGVHGRWDMLPGCRMPQQSGFGVHPQSCRPGHALLAALDLIAAPPLRNTWWNLGWARCLAVQIIQGSSTRADTGQAVTDFVSLVPGGPWSHYQTGLE